MRLTFSTGIKHYDSREHMRLREEIAIPIKAPAFRGNQMIWDSEWLIETEFKSQNPDAIAVSSHLRMIRGRLKASAPFIGMLIEGWSEDHYLLMPGAVYKGNRFESRSIPYSPKLSDSEDIGKDIEMIISDIPRLNKHHGVSRIQERTGALSVPLIGIFDPHGRRSVFIKIPVRGTSGDTGIRLEENEGREQLEIQLISPVIREETCYTIANNTTPTTDVPPDLAPGFIEDLEIQVLSKNSADIKEFFSHFFKLRAHWDEREVPEARLPLQSAFDVQEKKFNKRNWVEDPGYYSVGMRENFLQDWQIGWTGGLISTYPLLCAGREETKLRAIRNIGLIMDKGISPSGFFWDSGEGGTRWYGGDIRREHTKNWHLIRKSGDALFYLVKQFMLMDKQERMLPPFWKRRLRMVADSFVRLWKQEGQLGQFVHSESGEIIVGGSSSGAIVPAALAISSDYFMDGSYLETAKAIAEKYHGDFVCKGFSCGGPGDALQCPDSESSYALLESFVCLHEHDPEGPWLVYAKEMAHQFSSWVYSYNYSFPASSTLGKLGAKTKGCVMANVQNKHGSPGICTHSGSALLRLCHYTGDGAYARLLEEITGSIPQFLSHSGNKIPGLEDGWISERVSTTDWFEGIGEIMKGSTWAETSLMLTYAELPGFFIDTKASKLYCFDQLKAFMSEAGELEIYNHTDTLVSTRVLERSNLPPGAAWPVDIGPFCSIIHIDPNSTLKFNFK